MNVSDSEVISELLEQMNYIKVDKPELADCIVFNTCCVREKADLKVYGKLGEFKGLKRRNPDMRIVVCGCLAQKDAKFLAKTFPQVDIILGTNRLGRLPLAVMEAGHSKKAVIDVAGIKERDIEELPSRREGSLSAWLPVSFGCDNFCTFCIVPFVRGRLRSRSITSILNEAKRLTAQGFKEITLLGQNINEYGFDRKEKSGFGDLLEILDQIPGIERIRFTTSHPKDFSLDLVERIAKLKHICEHFHLPVQAGDDEVLAKMRRSYTIDQYLRLIDRIRELIPDSSITTDLITGFPGETEMQFQNTLELVKRARYDGAFMFAYSQREGTKAAIYEDQVPEEERMDRLHRLIHLQNSIALEKNKQEEGLIREVLAEGWSKKNTLMLTGRTRTNRIVVFDGLESDIGRLCQIKITKGYMWGTEGSLIKY